jgi:hypothetical protein
VNRNEALTERYEELRKTALGLHPGGMMWGLVVLKTKGMASWARSWQEHTQGAVPLRTSKGPDPGASPLSSTGDELVRVLAGMVWAFQREERA